MLTHNILFIKYYEGLINSTYKLLPIYEGRKYKTSSVVFSKEDAFKNYQIYLSNLLIEIHGNSQLFLCSENSIKLRNIFKGMIMDIQIDEHKKVKRLTMECINICKKIIDEIKEYEKRGEDIDFTIL